MLPFLQAQAASAEGDLVSTMYKASIAWNANLQPRRLEITQQSKYHTKRNTIDSLTYHVPFFVRYDGSAESENLCRYSRAHDSSIYAQFYGIQTSLSGERLLLCELGGNDLTQVTEKSARYSYNNPKGDPHNFVVLDEYGITRNIYDTSGGGRAKQIAGEQHTIVWETNDFILNTVKKSADTEYSAGFRLRDGRRNDVARLFLQLKRNIILLAEEPDRYLYRVEVRHLDDALTVTGRQQCGTLSFNNLMGSVTSTSGDWQGRKLRCELDKDAALPTLTVKYASLKRDSVEFATTHRFQIVMSKKVGNANWQNFFDATSTALYWDDGFEPADLTCETLVDDTISGGTIEVSNVDYTACTRPPTE